MTTKVPLWQTANVSTEQIDGLAEALALPRRVASWLIARNISDVKDARRFLYGREQVSDPFDFHDMRAAVERIKTAIEAQEIIVIVGDYDVDGVTASTILASELAAQGAVWHCLIPERLTDGYGLSSGLVERAEALGARLLITVDNGIRAAEAIVKAEELGMDVIVTDHHEPDETALPACRALIHWSKHLTPDEAIVLSGAGVAWKLCQALRNARPGRAQFPIDHDDWLLGLTALGAVSDMMPMRGENRRIIREGLAALRHCRRPGWMALCDRARVDADTLSATGISWRIAPRINAAGRIASAEVAFQLLMANERQTAANRADEMERLNAERRRLTDLAAAEAEALVQAMVGEDSAPRSIVVAGEWSLGVVGIVAAKLMNRYQCPVIVLADLGTEILRGSGRAPGGFSLHDAVADCAQWLHHFGGHDAAIGCGVERDKLDAFRAAFDAVVQTVDGMNDEGTEWPVLADDFLPLTEATLNTLDWTMRFSPHGPENEPLRFFVGPVYIAQITPLGDGSHVRLRVREGTTEADVVWFSTPVSARNELKSGQLVGLVVEMEENIWKGTRRMQLRVTDGFVLRHPVVRDVFAQFYRHLQKQRVVPEETFYALATAHDREAVAVILETFVELRFAAYRDGAYHVLEAVRPRDLREAVSYQAHLRTQLVGLT